MSSSHGNTHSEPARTEQIITEFFTKSLHIILESRCPFVSSRNYSGEQTVSSPSSSSSSSSSIRPRDKWFNLALRDCSAALEKVDLWHQSNPEPMIVDVILVQRPVNWDPIRSSPKRGLLRNLSCKDRCLNFSNPGQEEYLSELKKEKIIERWVVQYESRKSRDSGSGSKRSSGISPHSVYRKSTILLRSLYLTVRLLPAYKLYRDLSSSGQLCTFTLGHRVSSFVEPFTHREEAEMRKFSFTALDTSCGRLCLSVVYRPTLSDLSLEPLTPMSPHFIPDYVGSPTTDPLKRFPSLPLTGFVLQGSPSSIPFARRHSWSHDTYLASPHVSPSPSPSYSDSRALISNNSNRQLQHANLSCHPPETPTTSNASQVHKKNTSFDEYWPSPMFSPSPSPSPPMYIPSSHPSQTLLRSESAPVNIPAEKLGRTPGLPRNHMLRPSPSPKDIRPGASQIDNARASIRLGDIQPGVTTQKLLSIGKDDVGNVSGAKVSCNSSPRISFSRSSSRLSFQDEFDDSEFCPFAVDYDEMTDPHIRPESYDGKGPFSEALGPRGLMPVRKSQEAAVGALVCMLNNAPPLRPDLSNSTKLSQDSKPEPWSKRVQVRGDASKSEVAVVQNNADLGIMSSGVFMLKTTADALEELRSYSDMKDSLLKQGNVS